VYAATEAARRVSVDKQIPNVAKVILRRENDEEDEKIEDIVPSLVCVLALTLALALALAG
jgi:hypothetical protein